MIKKLSKTPTHWLDLPTCARIFGIFRKNLGYNEPIPEFETRYPGKLEGIIESVRQTYGGKFLNPTVLDSAAAYFNQLVRGHAFTNGNKRAAVLYTHYFLLRQGIDFSLTAGDLYNFAVYLARVGETERPPDETKEWCKRVIADFTVDLKQEPMFLVPLMARIWRRTRRR